MKQATKAIETREAILDATDTLLARYGYKKMTVDDIASEVGIGKGSIYLHFSSKEEIALSHIDRIVDLLLAKLVSITEEDTAPDEKLRRMTVIRVTHRFDSVQHYTVSLNELLAALRPQLLQRRNLYFAKESEIFRKVLDEGRESGLFHFEDSSHLADAFITATNSLLPLSLSTRELGKRKDIERRAMTIADLLIRGTARIDK